MANKAVNDAVHKLQLALIEGIETEKQLLAAGSLMSRSDYNDVVTERSIADLCGYPLCRNSLPPVDSRERKGRYRISLKERKVYNVHEMYLYCSTNCLVNSKAFSGSLNEERCVVLNPKKLEEVLGLFDCSKVEDLESKIMNLFDGLKVKENEETKAAGEGKAGPSDAIEGYVPQSWSKNKSSVKKKEGVSAKTNKVASKRDSFFSEMDFTTTVITNDEYSMSKIPCDSTKISSNLKLEAPKGKGGGKNFEDQCAVSGSLGYMEDDTHTTSRESTGKSKIVAKDELGAQEMPSALVPPPPQTVPEISAVEAEKESHVEKESISGATMLKSSLKSSGSKKLGHTVTWADEKIDHFGSRNLCEVRDMGDDGNVDNDDDILRLASAEACAMALSEAAETVASGDSDVADAVSEAGIVILPCPHEVDERKSMDDTDALESEAVPIKWPNKPGIPRSDMFDPEDSWYDAPPEGFSLTLSPFATMWMAIFSWITSSSLTYIYGRDESFHEEYLSVNGREYPQKIVLEDGRSSEIMQTLAGYLSRALPGLVTDLRLPTPVSTLEKGVERLLSTMSFIDPVPAFRMKQWQVIALLFIDALSVCKVPALTPHMMNRTMLIRKVLDGAHISSEEYEAMKDFIIPLGRAPHFSSQSGA